MGRLVFVPASDTVLQLADHLNRTHEMFHEVWPVLELQVAEVFGARPLYSLLIADG